MPQCMGIKGNGERCARGDSGFIHLEATHLHFCSMHWDVYDRRSEIRRRITLVHAEQHHVAGTCHKWISNQRWCRGQCGENELLCPQHIHAGEIRERRREAIAAQDARITDLLRMYRRGVMTWRQQVDHIYQHHGNEIRPVLYQVSHRYFRSRALAEPDFHQEWQFYEYWRWVAVLNRAGPPPGLVRPTPLVPPPTRNGLAAIARDNQNVHTRVVSEQTNAGLEKLLATSSENRVMRSPEWFAARWLTRSYGGWNNVQRTVTDMKHWYEMASCKAENDFLYRRALDGLFLLIKTISDVDTQIELYRRTFEECFESNGLCCEGHISRICNVLVGFDETFAPPVPFGEILQNKMAAISAMDIDTEGKIKHATEFFNEFAVPESERTAWLEAF
jgi:hypothetical protein